MAEQRMVQVPEATVKTIESAAMKGKEKIIKIGINHCKIQRVLKDELGEEVVVGEFEFGADYVYSQLAQLEAALTQWKDAKWVEQRISGLEAQKAKILEMKAVLEAN